MRAGERLVIHTPGGGGYGRPSERERERVRADVREGLVSAQVAKEVYGLVN